MQAHLILQRDALISTNKRGHEQNTFKSLLLKPFYTLTEQHRFAAADFRPRPSVATSLFTFTQRQKPLLPLAELPAYKDLLAYIAKDRVGEGNWARLFSKKQLRTLAENSDLTPNRGLKSQPITAIVHVFNSFKTLAPAKKALVKDAMTTLRAEQARANQHNQKHGHHRSRQRRARK